MLRCGFVTTEISLAFRMFT